MTARRAATWEPIFLREGARSHVAAIRRSRRSSRHITIQQGFVQRTPRGRLLTGHAFRHLGLSEPKRDPAQFGLFNNEDEA